MMFKISSMLFFLVLAVAFSITEGNLSGAAQEDIANDPRALRGNDRELTWRAGVSVSGSGRGRGGRGEGRGRGRGEGRGRGGQKPKNPTKPEPPKLRRELGKSNPRKQKPNKAPPKLRRELANPKPDPWWMPRKERLFN
mmetsp:Transcript_43142/g.46810  ORF Transcript_43142/g.46810 Transcript_43142/m.46810 type:complete len:139 (+) Transcript_43142:104-520(+)